MLKVKKARMHTQEDLIESYLQCDYDAQIGLACRWKKDEVYSIQIIDSFTFSITWWDGSHHYGHGVIRYGGDGCYEWDVFYAAPYDDSDPELCGVISAAEVHNAALPKPSLTGPTGSAPSPGRAIPSFRRAPLPPLFRSGWRWEAVLT